MTACTVPGFLREWFSARFEDACSWHDDRYVLRDCLKVEADYGVAVRIALRGIVYFPLGICTFIFLTINPIAYWLWFTE